MKKISTKEKLWLENRRKKINRAYSRIKNSNTKIKNQIKHNSSKVFNIAFPHNFSIVNNATETLSKFNYVIEEMKKKEFGKKFQFDLSEVEDLTTDAIMYLIAIIRNFKKSKLCNYSFGGNFPTNENARKKLVDSGFLNYVNSKNLHIKPTANNIQIISGTQVDSPLAQRVCDFIIKNCGCTKKDTTSIYIAIIELMTNTIQHAYNNNKRLLVTNWYIFIKYENDVFKIIFLDTGEGIPSTVNRKWPDILKFNNKESNILFSALKGEFRTETKDPSRGNGLPCILECCETGKFKNFTLFSGKGSCIINNNSSNYKNDYIEKLEGSLFYWEFIKK